MNDHELNIWKERFTAQKASGLTVLEWCAITYIRFYIVIIYKLVIKKMN